MTTSLSVITVLHIISFKGQVSWIHGGQAPCMHCQCLSSSIFYSHNVTWFENIFVSEIQPLIFRVSYTKVIAVLRLLLYACYFQND